MMGVDVVQCEYLVRGRRQCKRFTNDVGGSPKLCFNHQPDILRAQQQQLLRQEINDIIEHRKRRVSSSQKRMLNPFSFQAPTQDKISNILHSFHNLHSPFIIDIGCARGKFLLDLTRKAFGGNISAPDLNLIGMELRDWCVEDANREAEQLGYAQNLKYLTCSGNSMLRPLLTEIKQQTRAKQMKPLVLVCIQFPDPWSKAKRKRRRILQPELAQTIRDFMPPGGNVYISSDRLDVACEMHKILSQCTNRFGFKCFRQVTELSRRMPYTELAKQLQTQTSNKVLPKTLTTTMMSESQHKDASETDIDNDIEWLSSNPFRLPSERESVCEELARPIYRAIFERLPPSQFLTSL
eukprot:m.55299 g.55299  ORF g.55299 m.55299 type:complete len:352 (-) comp10976_c0_seq2:1701-2756(-)